MTIENREEILYMNDVGEFVTLAYEFPYFFEGMDGKDGLNARLTKLEFPSYDGNVVTETTIAERYLQLKGIIKGSTLDEIAEFRKTLLSVFNPEIRGELVYRYGSTERRIRCVVEHAPLFNNRMRYFHYQNFLVELMCPDPFWTGVGEVSEEIISGRSLFMFPLEIDSEYVFDSLDTSGGIVRNKGDIKTPVVIYFKGPLGAPITIENATTDERIVIRLDVADNERLEINTARGKVSVEKINLDTGIAEKAFQHIDIGQSTFFQLARGDNNIRVSTQEGEVGAVVVKHRNRYLGV